MRGRTRGAMFARLERLETRAAPVRPIKVRLGHLRRLPQDFVGDRHIIVAKQLPSQWGREWVEFEERPGPDPKPPQIRRGVPECIDVVFVPSPRTQSEVTGSMGVR